MYSTWCFGSGVPMFCYHRRDSYTSASINVFFDVADFVIRVKYQSFGAIKFSTQPTGACVIKIAAVILWIWIKTVVVIGAVEFSF